MHISPRLLKPLARAGYASRGAVYLIIGGFAIIGALALGGDKKSPTEAIVSLMEQPFGRALVWMLVCGLIGYALWRFTQSVFDTDDHGFDITGLAVRGGLLTSGVTYAFLAFFALKLLGAVGESANGGSEAGPLAWASATFGPTVSLVALAAVFVGIGGAHIWKAIKRKYADHFDAPQTAMPAIHVISIVGLIARGVVFFILAAIVTLRVFNDAGAGEKPNIADALAFVEQLPGGRWLLLTMGVGVTLFACYSLLEARWRHINVEDA